MPYDGVKVRVVQVADAVLVEPATVSYYCERAVPVVESYCVIVN